MNNRRNAIIILLIVFFNLIPASQTPRLSWKRSVGGKINGWQAEGPGGKLYLISQDRALHSLDIRTGEDLWRYRPGGRLLEFLAVSPDGSVYIQNDRGEIYSVNPDGGAKWRCLIGGRAVMQPLIGHGGTLYLVMKSREMISISRNGDINWITELGFSPSGSPVMDIDGRIFIPSVGGDVYIFSREGKTEGSYRSPEIEEMTVSPDGSVYGVTNKGRVFCWNSEGAKILDSGTSPGPYSSVIMVGNELYMVLKSGLIYKINETGAEGFYQGPEPLHPAVVSESGRIIIVGIDKKIWFIDIESGESLSMDPGAEPSLPMLTQNGFLVIGGSDWKIRGYSYEPPMEGWSQYRGNGSRNGTLYSVLSIHEREKLYRSSGKYRLTDRLFRTGKRENHLMMIEKIESYDSWYRLNDELPYWDLLLLKIAGEGVNRLVFEDGKAVRADPVLKARAYNLLGKWELLSARLPIIESLRKKSDPYVLASGYEPLGKIGGDWVCRSIETIRKTLKSAANIDPLQAVEAAEAAVKLLKWGGEKHRNKFSEIFTMLNSSSLPPETKNRIRSIYSGEIYQH